MNVIRPDQISTLEKLFEQYVSIRGAAREVGVNRKTSSRYYELWIEKELQRAYDFMCDGECEKCDEVTAPLPEKRVTEMLNAWLDDQEHRESVRIPLIHIETAGRLVKAGIARLSQSGRPDRSTSLMLCLSPYGKALVLAMGDRVQRWGP